MQYAGDSWLINESSRNKVALSIDVISNLKKYNLLAELENLLLKVKVNLNTQKQLNLF